MSNNNYDIFKRLKNYSVTPPPKIWEALQDEFFGKPGDAYLKIKSRELQNFEQKPPEILFEQIKVNYQRENIQAQQRVTGNERTSGRIIFLFRKYVVAAAIFIFILAVPFLLKKYSPQKQKGPDTVKVKSADKLLENQPKLNEKKTQAELTANKSHQTAPGKLSFHKQTDNWLAVSYVQINGDNLIVYENDLLYTFAKLKPKTVPSFFRSSDGKEIQISINEFTNISVSSYMQTIISELYKTGRKGKPTWKARRVKGRIEKWRKNDVKLFDKKMNANPLDIIDMGDSLFNY